MNTRKWASMAITWMLISLAFSITFFVTQNPVFTAIAWFFVMCEFFSLVQLVRFIRKDDNASNNL